MSANINFLRHCVRLMELGMKVEVIDFAKRYAKFYDTHSSIVIGSLL